MNILFLNHPQEQCGVHQFGKKIGLALEKYGIKYNWFYRTVNDEFQYWNILKEINPLAIIFNYYPSTMPWYGSIAPNTMIPKIGIVHEVYLWESLLNGFDKLIIPDPTWETNNSNVFITGRLIPDFISKPPPGELTIGSFGFGFANKGWTRLIDMVQNEFDEAKIRFNMTVATFGDPDGSQTRAVAEDCRQQINNPGINLEITHAFLSTNELLNWASQNTLNAFFYDAFTGRGISSAIDYALAVKRPIAVNSSYMFRHICTSSIHTEEISLKDIIKNGIKPLEEFYLKWTPQNLTKEYENIIDQIV